MKHLQLGIAWAVGEKWLILKRETLEVAALDVNSNGKLQSLDQNIWRLWKWTLC